MDIGTSMFDLKNIYLNLQIIIAVSAVLTIFYKLFMFFYKKIRGEYEHICKIHAMVETIYSELTPNHGTSLKDKVNSIEKTLGENTRTTSTILYRQRWLLDNRDEPIFESDSDGNCTWVNEKFCKLSGYKIQDFLNNGWKNIIYDKDRERIVDEWNNAIKDKRDSHATFHIMSQEGIIYRVHAVATRNADGGYIGNVTVEKRLESVPKEINYRLKQE